LEFFQVTVQDGKFVSNKGGFRGMIGGRGFVVTDGFHQGTVIVVGADEPQGDRKLISNPHSWTQQQPGRTIK
jgi:hypothetical protein